MEIAITGLGVVTAMGCGAAINHQHLLDGASALRAPAILPTTHTEWPIGEVTGLTGEPGSSGLTRNILLGLAALQEALADAGLTADDCAGIPLINGTTVGGMDLTEAHFGDWHVGRYDQLTLIQQHEAHFTTRKLAELAGLQCGATLSTACSSALNAIIEGAGLLRTGAAQCVVVGGTEAMTRFHLNGFASLGILSQQICRPFQPDRDGINLGEGAAYLVLEDATEARRRGQHIYGYLAGYGNRCDAFHQTASSPDGDGAYDAMQTALQMARLEARQIPYVNAHGTATPNNDASEWRAIERLYAGQALPVVESTKPLTGHTTSASGSIEAIFTLWRMQQHGYPYALSNAFGFGGNDSSILLSLEPVVLSQAKAVQPVRKTPVFESRGELDAKPYIPAMQARRMTPMTRQLVAVAHQALEAAGQEPIDGIVVGTRWGGMIPSMQMLRQLVEVGEQDFSPALFMSSTHNNAAGTLARLLNCKGYNTTVVDSNDPFQAARQDALLALKTGLAKRLLVCSFDELEPEWAALCGGMENVVRASIVLSVV